MLEGKRLLITGVMTRRSIAFAVAERAQREGAEVVLTSFYSLKAMAEALEPLFDGGGSLVGLDFDASVAWPVYDWMGVSKAALEAVGRYLARALGPRRGRVKLVSAGPVETLAAGGIPGFDRLATLWRDRAPLGWDTSDPGPVADAACFLLSPLSRAISGEIVHVDGGFHAMGAPGAPLAAAGAEPETEAVAG